MITKEPRTATQPIREGASRLHPHTDTRPEPEAMWDDEDRWAMIAENAYYRAERRGFLPGYELEDWLAAEQEVTERVS